MRFVVCKTGPVDDTGKCQHVLEWEDPRGAFRPEPHKLDSQPVGYRRGQYFHCHFEQHMSQLRDRGHEVVMREKSDRD